MKVYEICEFLNTDHINVCDADNKEVLLIEGKNAANAVATLFEHNNVIRITPTAYGVEIQIEE